LRQGEYRFLAGISRASRENGWFVIDFFNFLAEIFYFLAEKEYYLGKKIRISR